MTVPLESHSFWGFPKLSGAENFFESHNGQSRGSKWWRKAIVLVRFFEKVQDHYLIENLLPMRASISTKTLKCLLRENSENF
jgi:hypothetical protein